MNNDTELLKKRFAELSRRADGRSCLLYSGFLSLNEQSALASMARTLPAPYSLYGGADGCERRMARFGYAEGDDTEGYPIDIIEIAPRSEKFASDLTHRDFLGALMHTGVEREKIGDIIVRGKHAYAFVEASLAPYFADTLETVGRTSVVCRAGVPPFPRRCGGAFHGGARICERRACKGPFRCAKRGGHNLRARVRKVHILRRIGPKQKGQAGGGDKKVCVMI